MTRSILNGWLFGLCVLVAIYALWFLMVLLGKESEILMWLLWSAPLLSASLASYLCPRHIILFSVSITITTVLIALVSNSIYQLSGHPSDFSGTSGGIILASLTAIYGSVFSVTGSIFGNYLGIRRYP